MSTFSPSEIAKLRAVPEEAKSERYNGLKKQIEYLHKRIPDAGFIYIKNWLHKFEQAVKWITCYILNDQMVTIMEQSNGKEKT